MKTLIVNTDRVLEGTKLTVTFKLDKEKMGEKNLLTFTIVNRSKGWHFYPCFEYILEVSTDE